MTKVSNGRIIRGRIKGHVIEVWGTTDKGSSWSLIGTVASNSAINFGDIILLALPQFHLFVKKIYLINSKLLYVEVIMEELIGFMIVQ